MGRKHSEDWNVGDVITAQRMQDVNEELDDILENGSDRLRVSRAASGSPLAIDIGAGAYIIDSTKGTFSGQNNIALTNNATNYVMLTAAGNVTISTSSFNDDYARLATVVTSSGSITSIVLAKFDALGGAIGGASGFDRIASAAYDTPGYLTSVVSNGITYAITYDGIDEIATVANGSNTWTVNRNAERQITTIVKS